MSDTEPEGTRDADVPPDAGDEALLPPLDWRSPNMVFERHWRFIVFVLLMLTMGLRTGDGVHSGFTIFALVLLVWVPLVRYADRGHLDRFDAEVILRALCNPDPRAVVESAMQGAVADRVDLAAPPPGWWGSFAGAETLEDVRRIAAPLAGIAGPAFAEALDEAADWQPVNDGTRAHRSPVPTDWLLWLASDEGSNRAEVRPDAVCLTTIHGAKGLEWPAVVLVGACEGAIPARWDRTAEDVAESGRCLYVGVTRARDALVVVAPKLLRGKPRNPSRWLITAGLLAPPPADGVSPEEGGAS